MGIGGSIFLIAVGAIIAFAVDVSVGWLDLEVVGWVLMVAGVVGLILTMTIWNRRRTVTSVSDARTPVATTRTDTTYDVPEDPRY
ncbi:DUF6458 family protein [Luedemannella helvata]|uniref:DUF6458 domain-containing protein n=1 Tax=Luedemannella helvata TaxID=349315 RepID=A0ABP4XAM3_9ACTN